VKKNLYILLVLSFLSSSLVGQKILDLRNPNKHYYATARAMYGIAVPHHTSMIYFIDDFATSAEITFGLRNFDQESWASYFNYPEIGLGFYYSTYGNDEIYGEGLALFPYIQYNIFRRPRFSVQNKIATGIGYATKPYDINDNAYNTIFSTHFNIYIGLGLIADYRFSKHFSATLSGDLNHMSNGAAKKPNHGINVLTASIGAKYHFNKALTPSHKKIMPPKSSLKEFLVVASAGRSQTTTYNPQLYWNGSISINYLWHLNAKKAIGIGFDQFYSEAIPYVWDNYETSNTIPQYNNNDFLINGLFVSYNTFLGKTILFANLGFYLKHSIKPPQPVYPRVGARYAITNNLLASFSVKASFFRSEFLEFGLGYRFKHNKKKE